jgi:transcriptional repressor NrdR
MKCPYCMAHDSKVIDKRDSDVTSTRRRRECLMCHRRFTTYERVELVELTVVKKDGRRETFNPDKLRSGILSACEKRPVARATIDHMVDSIEGELRSMGKPEFSSTLLGELVMNRLRNLDQVAYIRFASVYRSFADAESFQSEVQLLLHPSDTGPDSEFGPAN